MVRAADGRNNTLARHGAERPGRRPGGRGGRSRHTKRTPAGDMPTAAAIWGQGTPRAAISRIRALRDARSVGAPAAIMAWRTASWDTPRWAAFRRRLAGA